MPPQLIKNAISKIKSNEMVSSLYRQTFPPAAAGGPSLASMCSCCLLFVRHCLFVGMRGIVLQIHSNNRDFNALLSNDIGR